MQSIHLVFLVRTTQENDTYLPIARGVLQSCYTGPGRRFGHRNSNLAHRYTCVLSSDTWNIKAI